MKALITGIEGAIGSHLSEYLAREHPEVTVYGIARRMCDLTDETAVGNVVDEADPDVVIHLASLTALRVSFSDSGRYLHENIIGTNNLLHALGLSARVLLMSTCEVYGKALWPVMNEAHPVAPMSPYAVSKAAQEMLATMYASVYGREVVIARGFNWINPRREDLFSSAWARQIARIERGEARMLEHGNLDSARTLADVRDVVRMIWLLATNGIPGEIYNLGTPVETPIRTVLAKLIERAAVPIETKQSPGLLRPVDLVSQVPDTKKFESLGWSGPRYTLDDSLDYLMGYWRAHAG